jgi:hypothetical protein
VPKPKALELPHVTISDPVLAKNRLLAEARQGLPVKGLDATPWEALRPKVVPETTANKVSVYRKG